MNLLELFILAIGLSMDAFAVAISKGLSMKKMSFKNAIIIGLYFGLFQAGMPLIGYFLGTKFQDKITAFDHWVAFFLLGFIGINMIREALSSDDEDDEKCVSLDFKTMSVLAIATSIDALAVGVTFAFFKVSIISAVALIGITTFTLSILGVKIGNVFGSKYKSKAEFVGGLILIGMGVKILISHL